MQRQFHSAEGDVTGMKISPIGRQKGEKLMRFSRDAIGRVHGNYETSSDDIDRSRFGGLKP